MRLHLFAHTAILFAAAQILGLVVADQLHALVFPTIERVAAPALPLAYFLIAFFLATLFLLVLHTLHKGAVVYRILFCGAVFVGLLKLFELVFPLPLAIGITLIFLFGFFLVPVVWAHDIIVIAASAGIGPVIGLQFTPFSALALLVILSIYDLVAVFVTRHMVAMAHHLIKSQASFALMIAERWSGFRQPLSRVQPGSGYLILGGGDIIIPMFFTTTVYLEQPASAYAAIVGMILGCFANHVWLMERRTPLPALPFITLGGALGMVIGSLMTNGI